MEKIAKYLILLTTAGIFLTLAWAEPFQREIKRQSVSHRKALPPDTIPPDTILPFPFNDQSVNPYEPQQSGGLYLNNPSNIKEEVVFDVDNNEYVIRKKIGNLDYRQPVYMSPSEYLQYDYDKQIQKYWREKTRANRLARGDGGIIPKIRIGGEAFDRIFGSNTIDIRPSGSAELIFGVISTRTDNPALDIKQRRNTNFDFQEKIQMNVTAKIGDKIQFGVNYNTEASFDFENKMNLKYEGKEDEIIQLIEAGDVTLPLNSTLITGSQALFGIKTKLKFGRTTVTGIFSQQKSKTENITVAGGAQTSEFLVKADEYEENKHFFLGHYFREQYTDALKKLPIITAPINITRMEVWVTNIGAATQENRNIVAFQDLGETSRIYNPLINPTGFYPDSNANDLLTNLVNAAQIRNLNNVSNYLSSRGLQAGRDYEKVELARKLSPSEYSYNSKLGFISLNTSLNSDQVLAVAYQYTRIGDTTLYQVGEFSTSGIDAPNCLVVKLLKSSSLNTKMPMWDLMMKNVYAIGGYQINNEDFRLNVLYSGEENGIPMGFLTEGQVNGIPLIKVLGCDRLNTNGDPVPDGVFDFVDGAATNGGTIQATNGRIFFPVLEPFGKDLRKAITGGDPLLNGIADRYCYDSLYTLTKSGAQQYPEKNKFAIEGFFKSASGAEISLGAMNVPQGSVKVTAGGIPLTENVDYTVDYTLGRVKIINEGVLNSGTPINISLESNSMFDIQTKTLMGAHVDYMVNKNFSLGATILNLTEKPLTQKVNFGDEPISNTIWGLNGNYQTESRLITKIVDFLPFIETKQVSNVVANAEFAHLIPGHSRAIGKNGTTYIDDFEGSKSTIDLKNVGSWFHASTPQQQTDMFPEAALNTGLAFNYNRARLAWYVIDPSVFYRNNNQKPSHITADDISNHFVREVFEEEVFPNKEPLNGQPSNIAILNLAYYPWERGVYNFDVDGSEGYSAGIEANGRLSSPESRWGGIMRKMETTDFEATNVEYIEFWMMDPFVYNPNHSGGQLYINLGDVSEDVLRDSRKSVENGLPTSDVIENVDTTIWGLVPNLQPLTYSFDNNEDARQYQDVGLDGMRNLVEQQFFSPYLQRIINAWGSGSPAYVNALNDPSSDDFRYFLGPDFDSEQKSILERYKRYNGQDGNSPTDQQTQDLYGVNYPMMATTLPDGEDINRDNTLNESERYFQYRIDLVPSKMVVGQNYIADVFEASTGRLPNGTNSTVKWYQFKIPITDPDRIVGGIQDFKSIRFMRMYLKGFSDSVICRFATLDVVRGDWRRYRYSLLSPGEYIPNDDQSTTSFDVSAVNIEENGQRSPIPYVLPPGIEREINISSTNLQQLNEQALTMDVCNLMDGDARAIYKTCDFDLRQFKKLQMYAHAEATYSYDPLNDGDLMLFVRLGSDFTGNYYEYEMPLYVTEWGTSAERSDLIWPEKNRMEIVLENLVDAKKNRNTALREPGTTITLSSPYVTYDESNNKITVVGNPNLSAVKTIMIGVRNPKKLNSTTADDGKPKCAEIWVNELRLTDFDEKGGWAATGRVASTLADFGNISLAGTISTPGFGSIDKKVNERQKETMLSYDIATNLELGKFFPDNWGLRIPMHFDYSEIISTPQYNPLNPDILYKEDIQTYETRREKDSIREITQDYTRRKSLNFVNVRKDKTGSGKTHIYDIENFDFTYAYTEVFHRNVDVEYDVKTTHRGGLGYNFTMNPKPIRPFDKIKLISKSKWLRIIKDFNFYTAPKMLSFRTDLDRQFSENLLRPKSNAIIILEPTYIKTFNWNRDYSLKYDLTQSLKIDYRARAIAQIDEPPGKIDKDEPDYREKRDSIWNNVLDFGRMKSYSQSIDINYTLPINKIPWFNWTNISARYGGEFKWDALPLTADDNGAIIENPLGNVIENANTKQLNFNGNLNNLYSKVPYLKKVLDKKKGVQPSRKPVAVLPADKDTTETKINYAKEIIDNTLSLLMSVKTINISYQEGTGRLLPGFMPKPVALGMDWNNMAPGLDFVFGNPSEIFGGSSNILDQAYARQWISADTNLNTPFATKANKSLNAQITVEPLPNFRIDVTANTTFGKQYSAYYRYAGEGRHSDPFSPMENGSFSMSYITWNTAFTGDRKDNTNAIFEKFKEYRIIIAQRLAAQNPSSSGQTDPATGFPDGYGPTSQDVLIPAFLAAYAGKDPDKISLAPFSERILSSIPLPNWRLNYTGLSKINFLKKYFKTIALTHTYRNTYSINSYMSNLRFRDPDEDGFTYVRDAAKNFVPMNEIAQISINEQFSPLIGFDMTMTNSVLLKLEWKKSRNLSLSFSNNQLTDVSTNEYIIGAGYRIKDVSFTLNFSGRKRPIKSDLNLKADFSIRNNKTVLRKLVEEMDQVSAGQRVMSINVSADYKISDKLNIRLFFDKIINNPFISSQYPNSNTNAGISLRFSLAQ